MSKLNNQVFICNDEFEIVRITEKLYDETVRLFMDHHLKYENVNIACNLMESKDAVEEMEKLLRAVLKDGISFGAKHCESGELAAFAGNKLFCPKADVTLTPVYEQFRTKKMWAIGQYIERLESGFDLYKEWNVDCIMEIFFLSTHKKYAGRGLATLLAKHSIDFARQMLQGTLEDRACLPASVRDLKPQAVSAVFSSAFSQKVGERLGFETLNKIPNTEFSFEGKSFAECLDPVHTHSTFAALKL